MSNATAVINAVAADATRTPEELLEVALATAARLEGSAGRLELQRLPADFVYVAQDGDTLDLIAYRRYGTVAALRHVQAANPDLTAQAPRLAAGTRVRLPDIEVTPEDEARVVQLWD